jgi:hypothetical protein
MYQCPVCGHRTIPTLYAFTPQIIQKPIQCGSCGTTLEQVHGWRVVIPEVPLVAAMYAVHLFGATPEWLVWFVMALALLLGVSLWAHTIEFRAVPSSEGTQGTFRPKVGPEKPNV